MVDSSMGERIAGLRRERGLSQAGLAAATGVSRSAVAQWETDRAGQVSGNLSRIAQVLDVARGAQGLTGDELALLRLYRACGADKRSELLRAARRLARTRVKPDAPQDV